MSNQFSELNILSNFYGWIIFGKQEYEIPGIPKMFSECLAIFDMSVAYAEKAMNYT